MLQQYCVEIKKRKRPTCIQPGCGKGARGKTNKCIAHGGGTRCVEPGCGKGAEGKTKKCLAQKILENMQKLEKK